MSNHLISVIVPVYNVEPYLRQCLDSIVNQTYPNIEILIVDDGSPDHCGEICDEYAEKDSRIIVIHQENAGLSAARNAALDIARGEYIMFVDSDDWVEPTFCEKALEMVLEYQVETVWFGYRVHYLDKIEERRTGLPRLFDSSEIIKHLVLCDDASLNIGIWNKIYHRRLFEKLRFPLGLIYEDVEIICQIIHLTKSIFVSNEVSYNYRKRNGSITSIENKKNIRNIIDYFIIYHKRLSFLLHHYPDLLEHEIIVLARFVIFRIGILNGNTPEEAQTRKMMKEFLYTNKSFILSRTNDKYLRFCLWSKTTLRLFGWLTLLKKSHIERIKLHK